MVQGTSEEALRKRDQSGRFAQKALFMARLNSAEVSGYGALSNVLLRR